MDPFSIILYSLQTNNLAPTCRNKSPAKRVALLAAGRKIAKSQHSGRTKPDKYPVAKHSVERNLLTEKAEQNRCPHGTSNQSSWTRTNTERKYFCCQNSDITNKENLENKFSRWEYKNKGEMAKYKRM